MPLFKQNDPVSQDPQIRQFEKTIAMQAENDQKTLVHAVKDLKNAESSHSKGIKAADKAQGALDKAVKDEYKAAEILNDANNKHHAAVSNQQAAEETLNLKQQHEQRLQQDLDQRRHTLEATEKRKQANDHRREMTLSQVHAQAASETGGGTGDPPLGPNPTGSQNGNPSPGVGPAGAAA